MKTNKIKIDNILKKYFTNFSNKNIFELNRMFSKNITLKDWNIDVTGKKKVLNVNKKIFKNKKIKVKHEETYYNYANNVFGCKLVVTINKKKLNVIDLIYLDKKMKIKKIIAYLR